MNRTDVERLNAEILTMWTQYHELTREEMVSRINNWQASLDRDMPAEFAAEYVRRRFGTVGAREPKPGELNHAWRAERAQRDRPKPCGDPMCDGHGWVNTHFPKSSGKNDFATKCPNCPPRIRVSGLHSVNDREPATTAPPEFYAAMRELSNRKRMK